MLDHINMHSSSQSHLKREKLEAQSKHSKTLMLQLLLLLANLVCTSNHSQAGSVHHHRTKPWPSTDQEINRSSLLHHPYHRQMQSKCPTTPNQLAILSRLRQADENSDQVLGHSTMITPQDDLSALWLSSRSLSLSLIGSKGLHNGDGVWGGGRTGDPAWISSPCPWCMVDTLLDCMPEAILTRVHSPANAERHNNLVAKVWSVSACWMPFHLKLAWCWYPVGCVVKMNSSKLQKWIGQLSGPNIIDLLLHFKQLLVQVH